jgi:hypothetical protein
VVTPYKSLVSISIGGDALRCTCRVAPQHRSRRKHAYWARRRRPGYTIHAAGARCGRAAYGAHVRVLVAHVRVLVVHVRVLVAHVRVLVVHVRVLVAHVRAGTGGARAGTGGARAGTGGVWFWWRTCDLMIRPQ